MRAKGLTAPGYHGDVTGKRIQTIVWQTMSVCYNKKYIIVWIRYQQHRRGVPVR